MSENKTVYPRTCSATGEGLHEGYLCHDGTIFKYEKNLVNWIKSRQHNHLDEKLSDEFILKEAYDQEEYLWTEWYDDDIYEDINDIHPVDVKEIPVEAQVINWKDGTGTTMTNKNEILTVKTTTMNENKTTINFMYYANNFNHDWINKVWSNNAHICEHLTSKWDALNHNNNDGGTANFFKLFMQLDDNNRNILLDWIKENYKG